jgi:hypothetical protein
MTIELQIDYLSYNTMLDLSLGKFVDNLLIIENFQLNFFLHIHS